MVMYYSRKLEKEIEKYFNIKEIVLITGMRRVGKTTLLRYIFENIKNDNKVFLDIENPLEQRIFEELDYNNIWANLKSYGISNKQKAYLFLDEVQDRPEIVKAIKYLYDHYDVKFFISGSSSFYLKNLFPESLAGRKVVLEIYPLDFEEFLVFKGYKKNFAQNFIEKDRGKNAVSYEKEKKFYDEYLEFGGFPQVVLADRLDNKKQYLNDIFKSYFEKEVEKLADFSKLASFRDLLLLLLERIGAKLDISKLASEVGVSRDTVYSYLSFLEATYFISLVSPFSKGFDRAVRGAKKVYICDTGLVNHLSRVTPGAVLENAVYQNIRKYGKIQYYEKRGGAEIDFILKDQLIAFEVKQTGTIQDYRKLSAAAEKLGLIQWYILSKKFINQNAFITASDL
ncbi:MAG: ATP-binding protein [Armatimonadetes bacterium]|nr:ATP-binding protein [Armatimonadota bacterium]